MNENGGMFDVVGEKFDENSGKIYENGGNFGMSGQIGGKFDGFGGKFGQSGQIGGCLLYTSPSPRD